MYYVLHLTTNCHDIYALLPLADIFCRVSGRYKLVVCDFLKHVCTLATAENTSAVCLNCQAGSTSYAVSAPPKKYVDIDMSSFKLQRIFCRDTSTQHFHACMCSRLRAGNPHKYAVHTGFSADWSDIAREFISEYRFFLWTVEWDISIRRSKLFS